MKKNINYLLFLLFTIVSIFSVQSVKADSSQCTIYITGGSADSVTYSYSDVLKKCRITPPYSNPKVTLHSGTKHISYNKVSYNFTLSGLKDLKSATSEYVDITYKDANSTEKSVNIRFSFISTSSDSATSSVCCKLPSGSYKTYSGSSCGRNQKVDNSFCKAKQDNSSSSSSTEETPACYQSSSTNIRIWGTESAAKSKFGNTKVTKTDISQSECTKNNATIKKENDLKDIEASGTLATGTSSPTEQGRSSCDSYIIRRVRGYNTSKNVSYVKDDYFRSAIGLAGSQYQYYYVYKTNYNCDGFDKNTQVTAFCVDPGAKGAENSGTKYRNGSTIGKDTALGKGLYHLYTYWYLDHRDEISSTYAGGNANGREDLIDYVINNVARQLINNYGKSAGISFTDPLKNGYGTGSQLTVEYNAYKKKTVGVDALSTLKSKEILTKVWQDTDDYASGRKTETAYETEVKFAINQDSSNTKNSKKGFDTEFTVTIQSSDKTILESIKNNYKITASVVENNNQKDISGAITSKIDDAGWQVSSDGTTMTAKFKVSADDIYSYTSETVDKVNVNFEIKYQDPRSIYNILYLTPVSGTYQKFISFLSGEVSRSQSVAVEVGKEQKSVCKPTFAMPCTGPENVVYLIEGTQSGTLFNTVMAGIKSVDDVKSIISSAYNIVEILKNKGFSSLTDTDLDLIGGMIYNMADKVGIVPNMKNEFSFLQVLANNNNATAGELYKAINNMATKTTAKERFLELEKFMVNSLVNLYANGYSRTVSEFQDIMDQAEIQLANNKMTKSAYSFLETMQNLIKSSNNGNTLSNVTNGIKTLTEEYFTKLTDIDSIKSMAVSFTTTISNTIQSSSLGNIYRQLGNTWDQIKNVKSLSDINISGLYDSLTSAFTVNWEKCIIGENNTEATDPAGNSYTVQAQNMYCKVVCKEDYAIKMPGNLGTVYAGQNLSINLDNVYHATVGMAGQRTCVTTKIDNDAYVKDAVEVKDQILEAYNHFQREYTYYKNLKDNYKSFQDKEKAAYNGGINPVSEVIDLNGIKADFENIVRNAMTTFLNYLINPTTPADRELFDKLKKNLDENLVGDTGIAMKLVGSFIKNGEIPTEDITKILSSTIGEYGESLKKDFKKRFDAAITATVTSMKNDLEVAAKKYAVDGALALLEKVGQVALTTACQTLTKIPIAQEIALPVCEAYAGATTAISNVIIRVSDATINNLKIFAIHDYTNLTVKGDYNKFKYSDSTDDIAKLKSSITELSELANDGDLAFGKDRLQLWVMQSGSYNMSTTYFGWTFHYSMLKKALEKFKNLSTLDIGNLKDSLESISNIAGKLNDSSYSSIKKSKGELESISSSGMINEVINLVNNIASSLSDIGGVTGSLQGDITDYIDTTLDGIYYFLGAFDPYYYQVAMIRENMAKYKKEYDSYRDQLAKLSGNMNQCTMFDNEYQFNPDLVFSYGTSQNSVLDYIINRKNTTTDSIRLEAMNKPDQAETVTYYCKDDVPINKIQDISTIVSGKCTTSDGMIGSVVASVFGDDNAMTTFLNQFKQNSAGLKVLLNNDKVKEYINKSGYGDALNKFLCTGLGTAFCDLIGGDESTDGSLLTTIPGDIVYSFNGETLNSNTWNTIKSSISGGLQGVDSALTKVLKYTTTSENKFTYRNAKRVVSVSRYGNPGVSISGLGLSSLISNIATWLASETNNADTSSVINKVNSTVMSVTGQGAQQFIYYRSSQEYWTSSNKGIYTKAKTSDDSVHVDLGDEALTNDSIKTIDGSAKTDDGKVYPIALSTQKGTYKYEISINNVGQYYNNTLALGRIIDNNGYISGLLANKYVCKYEVKKEPDIPKNDCDTIMESSDCRDENGYFKDSYRANPKDTLYAEKQTTCINKLLAAGSSCCYKISEGEVPDAASEKYNNYCKNKDKHDNPCSRIELTGANSAIKGSSSATGNSALIDENGTLQFYTKVVSNYDLFPNGDTSKGYNWNGKTSGYENTNEDGTPGKQDVSTIIDDIEAVGDNIYADGEKYLEFSITMNSACMNAIKTYNRNQELNDLGFEDYTKGSISAKSRAYKSQFLADIASKSEYASCKIDSYLK